MGSQAVLFNVQKRGAQFYVVRSAESVGTKETGPYADAGTANTAAIAARDAFIAVDASRGPLVHVEIYPV